MSPVPEYWFSRIAKAWRVRTESITSEALPKRWIELLNHLNEKESQHLPPGSEPVGDAVKSKELP